MSSMRAMKVLGKQPSKALLNKHLNITLHPAARNIGFLTILSRFAKIRYFIFGSAIGGGVLAHNVCLLT